MSAQRKSVWLMQEGEPVPIESNSQILRTGLLARQLESAGLDVTWFASCFSHGKKKAIAAPNSFVSLSPSYKICLLAGRGYSKNMSLGRIVHQHQTAAAFTKMAATLPRPDFIVASYPSPELCYAASKYAVDNQIPYFVDVRDPWPDSFLEEAPALLKLFVLPLLWYYRNFLRRSLRSAKGIISMNRTIFQWAFKYINRSPSENDRIFYLGSAAPPKTDHERVPAIFTKDQPLICVFYGSFGKAHNGAIVVDVARLFQEMNETRVRFVMAGDGDQKVAWQIRAAGLNNIEFSGWVSAEKAQQLLHRSHIGFTTLLGHTRRTWFGNKFFEYTGHGLMLINNVLGEVAELVTQQELGQNIASHDPREAAREVYAIISEHLENPLKLKQKMSNSAALFQQKFTVEKIYQEYCSFLLDTYSANCSARVGNL